MNITRNIITDLLPLYYSGECSEDTKLLVEKYLQNNPDFRQQANLLSQNPFPDRIPPNLNTDDEMKSLVRTRRLLRIRSYVMASAIFCSLAPFSFFSTEEKFYWLFSYSPTSALIYGILGICLWATYWVVKRKTHNL